jgi:hypothetical protein
VVQLSKRISEILSVDQLVGRILEAHLPAMGRARWWRDEEELASIRKSKVLIALVDRCRHAKVDTALLTHDSLVIPYLANGDSSLLVEEGDNDTAEGFQRRESVNGCGVGDEIADDLEVLGEEDGRVGEVGEEEGV